MSRRAFTLVEVLVTVAIIGILAGMVTGALIVARNSAREVATKATIVKLTKLLMAKVENYRTRRLPLDAEGIRWVAIHRLGWSPASPDDPVPTRVAALVRLQAIRDLQRMEMPDRTADIQDAPIFFPPTFTGTGEWLTYRAKHLDAAGQPKRSSEHPSAQMLYLLVAVGPEMREARIRFAASEKADTDGDGRPDVFVDGWGRPIYWLRWAPGFTDTDIQSQSTERENRDPLDYYMVDDGAFRLVPLVYSAGPDGEYGIWQDAVAPDPIYHWTGDVYAPITDSRLGREVHMGEIISGGAYDNITSHRLEPER